MFDSQKALFLALILITLPGGFLIWKIHALRITLIDSPQQYPLLGLLNSCWVYLIESCLLNQKHVIIACDQA
jgi:hypothetical protein